MLTEKITSILDEIESELKLIGFWQTNPPEFKVANYLEAPSFELWLQSIFIPNARAATRNNKYPNNSQVGQMAFRQYDYHTHVKEAQKLIRLLNEFDNLINTRGKNST